MRLYQPSPRFTRSSSLTSSEKIIIAIASLLFVVGIAGYFIQQRLAHHNQPQPGGTYVEGVVDDSPTKVDRLVAQLTNIGLTYRDSDDSIKPALAESWDVSSDNKTYTFHIRKGYDANALFATIQSSKTNWSGIKISAPDSSTIQFVLNEPLPSFLSTTTAPLFPFGPYEIVKRDTGDVIFRPSSQFPLQAAYIQKFEIRTYPNIDQLTKAFNDGEIDGSADFTTSPSSSLKQYDVNLPRYFILFFNTTKPGLKSADARARIINQQDGPPVTYTLMTSQSPDTATLADNLARSLALKHITINVQKINSISLQQTELPKRDYDLLLYGIDYGVYRDYYPFWHSSQATGTGLNVDGIKDKTLDSLLESARKAQDPAQHDQLNQQIETYLKTNSLQDVLSQEQIHFWISKSIQGVKYGTIDESSDRFELVWQWYVSS